MTKWIDGAGHDINIGDTILYYVYSGSSVTRTARIVYDRGLTTNRVRDKKPALYR